ncbi:MAG TPA: signal peptidase I [Chloroflexota bacterium]|nr:signal peptidase I [Chloroflexota bacterium]
MATVLSQAQLRDLIPLEFSIDGDSAGGTDALSAGSSMAPTVQHELLALAGAGAISLPTPWWRRVTQVTARVALVLPTFAVLGLALLFIAAKLLLGWYPMIVYTGSMEPAIPVGAVVVVRPVAVGHLAVGDVISFHAPQAGHLPVTHRISEIEYFDGSESGTGGWRLVTKGDANHNPDVWRVDEQQLTGRVEFAVPFIGYFLVSIATPAIRNAILAIIAILAVARAVHQLNLGSNDSHATAPVAR